MFTKRKPYRNRKLLDAAKGQSCIRCGADDGTIVAAHYSGLYSDQLGKGAGQKAWDLFVAFLCRDCHATFDSYKDGNDDARAAKFMLLILKTQMRLLDMGVIK